MSLHSIISDDNDLYHDDWDEQLFFYPNTNTSESAEVEFFGDVSEERGEGSVDEISITCKAVDLPNIKEECIIRRGQLFYSVTSWRPNLTDIIIEARRHKRQFVGSL